jgi:hypothetical protein
MRSHFVILLVALSTWDARPGFSQGFVNLGFESAQITTGTPMGASIPLTRAFPGWSGPTFAWYNGISLGGPALSIMDSNGMQYGVTPLQGGYSAYLFGGHIPGVPNPFIDTSIWQTGIVPEGTASLRLSAYSWHGFTVSLGGHPLTMVPLQTFSSYTRYGADISAFSGQTLELRITAPYVYGTTPPNGLLLDSIVFSSTPIPEPIFGTFIGLALALISLRRNCHL